MPTFQLFRTQVRPASDSPPLPFEAASNPLTPQEAMVAALTEGPSAELRRGQVWHIGNVQKVDDTGWYFAIGRTTRSAMELYDQQTKRFDDVEYEMSPYTHVVLDANLGVCGIALKPRLSATPDGIARRLDSLLDRTTVAKDGHIVFETARVSDPLEFVTRLTQAHAVKVFTFEFGLPNAWDVEKQIIKPAQQTARELKARRGASTFKGESLDKDRLAEIARSTAAVGNDASAQIEEEPDSKGTSWDRLKNRLLASGRIEHRQNRYYAIQPQESRKSLKAA